MRYLFAPLVAALTLGVASSSLASTPGPPVGPSYQPQMTGSASAPVTANINARVAYVLTQTDKDTDVDGTQIIDFTCGIVGTTITSMKAGFGATKRGVDANGTFTWDVLGEGVGVPGDYIDTWTLFNGRPAGDVFLDNPLGVQQRVTLRNP